MGFESIPGNDSAKNLLKNEIKKGKKSGTYLFYGRKGTNLLEFALGFAKSLNCDEEGYCDNCRVCNNIDKLIYPDLVIVEPMGTGVKIDQIRELIIKAASSSYEGKNKVFIIKGVNNIRKEAINALLKTIEEPLDSTFFILLSNTMNVLPTIVSRSIVVKFEPLSLKELDVSKQVYDFFEGNIQDILEYKNGEYDLSLSVEEDLKEIITEYKEEINLESKIKIIKKIEKFINDLKFMNDLEKILISEELESSIGTDRELLKEILHLFIVKLKNVSKTEDLLEIKGSISSNVNIPMVLNNFFMTI